MLCFLWLSSEALRPIGTQKPDQERDEEGAKEVEDEAGVGLETEDTRGDAEQGGGKGADGCEDLRGSRD